MSQFFSKREYQSIADLYKLGSIESIVYFRKGYQTPKVAVVTSNGRFIIAKHNLSTKRAVVADMKIIPRIALMREIEFLQTLKNLPVPRYVYSKRGKHLEHFKGFGISSYVFLLGNQPKKLNAMMVYQLGKFVGEFHKQGSKYKKGMQGRRRFYDLNPRVMKLMHRYAKKQTHPVLQAAVPEVMAGVESSRLPQNLPKGPVHVDIKPDNELFIGNRLTGIVDFGNTYVDSLLFDVGKTIMWNCVRGKRLDAVLVKKFIEGYEEKRKLSKKERSCLKQSILFAIYSHIWVDLYHVPIGYVPESYTLFLVKKFLPVAWNLRNTTHEF